MQEHLTESGPDILAALRRAHDASVVEFTYTKKKDGSVSQRRLVVQTLGEEKVLGYDLDAQGIRSFAISGITELVSASPPEIDRAPLAEALMELDAVRANDDIDALDISIGLHQVELAARKIAGDLLVVPVETGEEPPL